jgi:hypothetical protein
MHQPKVHQANTLQLRQDGKSLGVRLNYISVVSSLDGSWDQARDELRPLIATLGDDCPNATRHLKRALKCLKTVARSLRLIYPE